VTKPGERADKKRRVDISLQDMRDSSDAIADYLRDITEAEFRQDPMRQDAVIRRLEVIGEAAGRIMKADRQFEDTLSEIPLRDAYEMRNFVSHGYDAVDIAIVWDSATNDIPALRKVLEEVIAGRKDDEKKSDA